MKGIYVIFFKGDLQIYSHYILLAYFSPSPLFHSSESILGNSRHFCYKYGYVCFKKYLTVKNFLKCKGPKGN